MALRRQHSFQLAACASAGNVAVSPVEPRVLAGVRGVLSGVRGVLSGVRGVLSGVRGVLSGVRGALGAAGRRLGGGVLPADTYVKLCHFILHNILRRDGDPAAEQSAMSGTGMTQEMEALAFEGDSDGEELTLEEAEEGARLYDETQVVLQLEPLDTNA